MGGALSNSQIRAEALQNNRVNTGNPTSSLIIREPGGLVSHSGGTQPGWSVGSITSCAAASAPVNIPGSSQKRAVTLRWICQGTPNN